jgi:hypothetical protein
VWVGTSTADLATRNDLSDPPPPRDSTQPPAEPGVSVLFSVPKKIFKQAWKRNLIKRRMRESYRTRKHELVAVVTAARQHIDIALICSPPVAKGDAAGGGKGSSAGAKRNAAARTGAGTGAAIPDFKTVDNAIEKILAKVLERR